jgi:hypothetical protein
MKYDIDVYRDFVKDCDEAIEEKNKKVVQEDNIDIYDQVRKYLQKVALSKPVNCGLVISGRSARELVDDKSPQILQVFTQDNIYNIMESLKPGEELTRNRRFNMLGAEFYANVMKSDVSSEINVLRSRTFEPIVIDLYIIDDYSKDFTILVAEQQKIARYQLAIYELEDTRWNNVYATPEYIKDDPTTYDL